LVSGTGSTVFGLFAEKEKALGGWRELRKRAPALLVKSLPRETYWRRLRAGA
jgi:4-diphosphocytidyl-2C-methyl-D-erythritol kinase